jgi:hypothetical protein
MLIFTVKMHLISLPQRADYYTIDTTLVVLINFLR